MFLTCAADLWLFDYWATSYSSSEGMGPVWLDPAYQATLAPWDMTWLIYHDGPAQAATAILTGAPSALCLHCLRILRTGRLNGAQPTPRSAWVAPMAATAWVLLLNIPGWLTLLLLAAARLSLVP